MSRWWPFFDLCIRTPRLELRPPTDADLDALVDVAAAGIHDPTEMPFSEPWTDQPAPQLQRGSLQWIWRTRAELSPERWRLPFAVRDNGVIVGVQDLFAERFATRGVVGTGSWLGRAHQGTGIGKEMRAAVLHLAFAELDAQRAETEAFEDNPASIAVTTALGYEPNGDEIAIRRDTDQVRLLRFVLDRKRWEERRRDDITVDGIGACRPLLGLD